MDLSYIKQQFVLEDDDVYKNISARKLYDTDSWAHTASSIDYYSSKRTPIKRYRLKARTKAWQCMTKQDILIDFAEPKPGSYMWRVISLDSSGKMKFNISDPDEEFELASENDRKEICKMKKYSTSDNRTTDDFYEAFLWSIFFVLYLDDCSLQYICSKEAREWLDSVIGIDPDFKEMSIRDALQQRARDELISWLSTIDDKTPEARFDKRISSLKEFCFADFTKRISHNRFVAQNLAIDYNDKPLLDKAFDVYLSCKTSDFPNNDTEVYWTKAKDWECRATCRRFNVLHDGKVQIILADVSKYGFVKKFEDAGFHVYTADELQGAAEDLIKKDQEEMQEITERILKKQTEEKKKRDDYKGKWLLVKWSGNWADEIDVTSQCVMKESEWTSMKKDFNKFGDNELSIYIGTNENIDTTGREYIDACSIIEIPDASTREFLIEHVSAPNCHWSPTYVWNRLLEDVGEIDDEDYED